MVTPISGADTWLMLNNIPLSFQENDENLRAQAVEYKNNILRSLGSAPDQLEIRIDGELLETEHYGRWYWRPRYYAGLYEFQVSAPGYLPRFTRVRVLPQKLSQERYEAMLADLSAIAIDLLFRLNSPAGEKTIAEVQEQEASPLRDYVQVKKIIEQLRDVMLHIRRSPHRVLYPHCEQQELEEVRQFSCETVSLPGAVVTLPEHIVATWGVVCLPELWMVQQSDLTYDVYENRLLKQFIQHQLVTKLSIIQQRARSEIKRREKERIIKLSRGWEDDQTPEIRKLEQVIEDCRQMTRWCIAWSSETFLSSVKSSALSGKATQVLLKNPSYSRFYRLYLTFQQKLKISLDTERYLTMLALRKMQDLYEIWSVFQITKMVMDDLLRADYHIISNTIFYEVERNHFQFEVRKNASSIVLAKGDLSVVMQYEPVYHSHLSIGNIAAFAANTRKDSYLTPDMAIEVYEKGQPRQAIIFDAKYRWQKGADGLHYPKDENIDKMRKYRDLICYKPYHAEEPDQRPQKIVSGAYILYPGDELYKEPMNEIGALPLVPHMEPQNKHEVEKVVRGLLESANLL